MSSQHAKEIVLGVTGGIAAYKAVSIVRLLKKAGHHVSVIMTENACEFVQPLTFQTVSERSVAVRSFRNADQDHPIQHISLSDQADLILIAPATANIIAKIAHGLADDLLSTSVLAAHCPVIIAPAMNTNMLTNPITQKNLKILKEFGFHIIEPATGDLACGISASGRLPEPDVIVNYTLSLLHTQQDLRDIQVLITAGPTQEKIDAVRYISNYSSGKMGYALATECQQRGANVTLISGPVKLQPPAGINLIQITTAQEMYTAVQRSFPQAQLIIKAAAVADYTPKETASHKIKKDHQTLQIDLVPTTDILAELGQQKTSQQFLVGFAAESENLEHYAQVKLQQKKLDLIIANNITEPGAGFNTDTNIITMIDQQQTQVLPQMLKKTASQKIIDYIINTEKWQSSILNQNL